jgi:hypothetical protein
VVILSVFTNRELALALWTLVFAAWALSKSEIRASCWELVKTAVAPPLGIVLLLACAYASTAVWAFYELGIWHTTSSKETVFWFFASALVLLFTYDRVAEDYGRTVRRTLALTVLFQFVINLYAFPLAAELVLVPIAAFLTLIIAADGAIPQAAVLKRPAEFLLGAIGVLVIGFTLAAVLSDPADLISAETVERWAVAPVMTLAFIPLLYGVSWYASASQRQALARLHSG